MSRGNEVIRILEAAGMPPSCATPQQYEHWRGPHRWPRGSFCEDCSEKWQDARDAMGLCDYRIIDRLLEKKANERLEA